MKTAFKYITFFIFSIAVAFLYTCKKDEMITREYPRVTTMEVTDIDSTGAVFTGEILYQGDEQITDHGFVWGQYSSELPYSENVSLGALNKGQKFTSRIDYALATGKKYTIKAYIKTSKFTVYGKDVEFFSLGSKAPKIISFWPDSARIGDTLYMHCQNISKINNEILIKGIKNFTRFKNDSVIFGVIPAGVDTIEAKVGITVYGNSSYSTKTLKMIPPKVTSISKSQATWGDTISIRGKDFGRFGYNRITLNNAIIPILSSSDSVIKFKIPDNLNKALSVIEVGPYKYPKLDFRLTPPELVSISLDSTRTPATITCKYKYVKKEFTKIFFKNIEQNINWSYYNNDISFEIREQVNGSYPIQLNVLGQVSNTKYIKIINPVIFGSGTKLVNCKDTVTLYGSNLLFITRITNSYSNIYDILEKSNDHIKFIVPENSFYNTNYSLSFYDENYRAYSSAVTLKLNNPQITDISPKIIKGYGDTIIISGNNFSKFVTVSLNNMTKITPLIVNKNIIKVFVNKAVRTDIDELTVHFFGEELKTKLSDFEISLTTPWKMKSKIPNYNSIYNKSNYGGFEIQGNGYVLVQEKDVQSLLEYNPQTDLWTLIDNSLIDTESGFCMFSNGAKGFIYPIYDGYSTRPLFKKLVSYDATQKKWDEISTFPSTVAKSFNNAIVCDNTIYFNSNDRIYNYSTNSYISDFYAYNLSTHSWQKKSSFPDDSYKAPLINLNGNLYSFNGITLKKYDCITNVWTLIPTSYKNFGYLIASFSYADKGYFIARDELNNFRIYKYDPAMNSWKKNTTVPINDSRFHFFANDKFYISDTNLTFFEYDPSLEP